MTTNAIATSEQHSHSRLAQNPQDIISEAEHLLKSAKRESSKEFMAARSKFETYLGHAKSEPDITPIAGKGKRPHELHFLWPTDSGQAPTLRPFESGQAHQNAMRLYHRSPLPRCQQSTVGELRALATHVNTQPQEGLGGERPNFGSGRVTSGDVNKMLAQVFS